MGTSKKDVEAPSIAMHRNNLTALSRYRNLLFIAYVDKIYVYTPSFPEQIITTKPEVVIDLPRSRPGLRGYLDPSRPHAVNHLIVGELGDEEVVVVACDDGDVISYNVRAISLAIDEGANTVFGPDAYQDQSINHYRQSGMSNLILPAVDPHWTPGFRVLAAWFHENVGASAWGLATHKDTMLLAVSSNTKEVYVFAPSLGPGRDRPSRSTYPPLDRVDKYTARDTRNSTASRDQSLGRKVTLRGHRANIPNVAFCDNSSDPEGRYLASTDIEGYSIIWDVWRCTRILETHGDRRPYARGWAVACLDPRMSRLCEGSVNTFGCACRVDESNTLIDNSDAAEMVHDNSQWHPGFSALGSVPGTLPTGPMPLALQTAVQPAAATTANLDLETEDEYEDETEDEVNQESNNIDNLDDASDGDALDDAEEAEVTAIGEALIVEPSVHTHEIGAVPPDPLSYTLENAGVEQLSSNEYYMLEDEDEDEVIPSFAFNLFDEIPVADQTDQQTNEAAEEHANAQSPDLRKDVDGFSDPVHAKTCPSLTDLPFNLLQTDEKDIHLFRDIRFDADFERRPPDSSHSQVLCEQALNQRMPPGFNYLTQMERLNMIAQIPELGVVVIGNQVGRVGILTMTRWEAEKQSGYKIECILPFKTEEDKGLRPRKLLMGMAVCPIQGQQTAIPHGSPRMGASPPRRFRLLMTYCDHTILSYEISRPDGQENILVV